MELGLYLCKKHTTYYYYYVLKHYIYKDSCAGRGGEGVVYME